MGTDGGDSYRQQPGRVGLGATAYAPREEIRMTTASATGTTGRAGIADILARYADAAPDSVALITDAGEYTFATLLHAARAVANELTAGTRVLVTIANDAASVVAIHGAWLAGCSIISASSMVPPVEVERRTRQTGAAAVLTPSDAGDLAVDVVDTGVRQPVPDGEAVVMFTSGTTGTPKGASLTFSALRGSVVGIATGSGLPADGRTPRTPARGPRLVLVPLAHMGGFLGTLTAWWLGKPALLIKKFSTQRVVDVARDFRIGVLSMTPAMVWEMTQLEETPELPGIDSANVGTAALPEATRLAFEEKYGIPVLRNYGQTEFAGAIAFERPTDIAAGLRPDGTVGRIAPGVEVAVLDASGVALPVGEIGEIAARAASAMSGYLDDEGKPAGYQGWLRTGDLGRIDDQDFVYIVGRVRDMVVCGGFNVYPAQVESALNDLSEVADSAVAGVPDDRLGEVPVAAVLLAANAEADAESLRRRLRERLAAYELPRRIVFVDAIPRRDTGKVDRDAVARIVRERTE
jgi:long-chain acyl-CoA synthetase